MACPGWHPVPSAHIQMPTLVGDRQPPALHCYWGSLINEAPRLPGIVGFFFFFFLLCLSLDDLELKK